MAQALKNSKIQIILNHSKTKPLPINSSIVINVEVLKFMFVKSLYICSGICDVIAPQLWSWL